MTAAGPQTSSVDSAWRQAVAHHQAGRLQEAEQLYRAILQTQPFHADANHNLGVLAVRAGKHAIGLPYLKTALAVNPGKALYAHSYAETLLAAGQEGEALNFLQSAMQRGLDTPAAHDLRRRAETAVRRDRAAGAEPPPDEIHQLVALFNAGRYAELESRARALVERFQDSGIAWKVLGVSLGVQGKEALSVLQNAARLSPEDAETHNTLGLALRGLGRLDEAVASYRLALGIQPRYAEAHGNLGNALRELGRLDESVASCRRALEIKPDLAEAHSNLGAALRDLGQLDGAVACLRRALEIKPDLAEAHGNLGNALIDLWQLDDAAASCRRALEIKPDFVDAHCNLGNVLQALGQIEDALPSYRRALEIKPDDADAHNNLGIALQALGRLDDALASFRRALECKPDLGAAYSNLLFFYAYHSAIDPQEYLVEAVSYTHLTLPTILRV